MAGEIPAPPAQRGFVGELLSLWGSGGRHICAIIELAGLEGREALALYLRLAVMLFAAVVFLVFGYLLILLFVAFLAALLFGVSWLWISLGLALLHFLVAFLCASHVRRHMRAPVFTSTSAEIRKDLDSLKSARP